MYNLYRHHRDVHEHEKTKEKQVHEEFQKSLHKSISIVLFIIEQRLSLALKYQERIANFVEQVFFLEVIILSKRWLKSLRK